MGVGNWELGGVGGGGVGQALACHLLEPMLTIIKKQLDPIEVIAYIISIKW